jgi:hypothetical protein
LFAAHITRNRAINRHWCTTVGIFKVAKPIRAPAFTLKNIYISSIAVYGILTKIAEVASLKFNFNLKKLLPDCFEENIVTWANAGVYSIVLVCYAGAAI